MNFKALDASKNIRERILRMSFESNHTSHLGGSLSLVEILSVLFFGNLKLDKKSMSEENRDRFVLSKGHGALALFATLIEAGYMEESMENRYMQNGSDLIAHPIKNGSIGIESSNGSLGQGLSFAVGLAIANRIRHRNGYIFCVLGDGECGEGSIWEAAMSAVDLNLTNLIVIVDCNGFQSDGQIRPSLTSEKLQAKWLSFEWNAKLLDGHNIDEISKAIIDKVPEKPLALICKTIKGKGVPFMEGNNTWHHNRLTAELYKDSLISVKAKTQ